MALDSSTALLPGMRSGPGHFVDAARIAGVRRLDQIAERDVQRFGHAIEGGQADVFFARLDRHQHAPADPGLFRQRGLAHVGGMAQAPDVLADVLQDGRPLR